MITTKARPAPIVTMPPALAEALLEFGLVHAFRTQPPAEQLRQVQRVESTVTLEDERERIAAVLDELAGHSFIQPLRRMG